MKNFNIKNKDTCPRILKDDLERWNWVKNIKLHLKIWYEKL